MDLGLSLNCGMPKRVVPDSTPVGLTFADVTDADVSTQYTANATVTAFDGSLTVTCTGTAEIRKNSTGSWGTSVSVSSGDIINARMTSSGSAETALTTTISLGTESDVWSITTAEAAGFTQLGALVASTVTDMSVVAGYSGSGTAWPNFEATPADSETQAAYDMTLSGLTFNGSAGVPGAYFSSDGNDYAALASGTNTTFLNGLHKNAAGTWWAAAVIKLPATVNDELHTLWATAAAGNETGMTALLGAGSVGADSGITVRQQKGGSSANKGSGDVMDTGGTYMIVMSHDQGTNETRIWVNGTQQGSGAHTYIASTTASASDCLRLLSTLNFYPAQSGTRLYEFSMGNTYLDDAGEALIRAEYELRTGLDLTI